MIEAQPVSFSEMLRQTKKHVTIEKLRQWQTEEKPRFMRKEQSRSADGGAPPPKTRLNVIAPGGSGFSSWGMGTLAKVPLIGNALGSNPAMACSGGGDGYGETEAQNMVECMGAGMLEMHLAGMLFKRAGRGLMKVFFRKQLARLGAKGIEQGLTEKMSESVASKVVEQAVIENTERELADAAVEAAVEAAMGPIGWALLIFQAIQMISDMGDEDNYAKMMTDENIEKMVGSMERSVQQATVQSGCKLVDMIMSKPPYNDPNIKASMKCFGECMKCRYRQWPTRKRPFQDVYSINDDPALAPRLHAYMIDYFRWMPAGTTPDSIRQQTCDGYLPPPHKDATGQPDYDRWVPRLYNSTGQRVRKPKASKDPDIRKYAFSSLQLWFMNTIMPFVFTQNYNLAIRMQQTKTSINVSILLLGLFVLLMILVLWSLMNVSTQIALNK